MNYSLTLTDKADETLRLAIISPLRAYNRAEAGPGNSRVLAVSLQNQKKQIVGGLYGRTAYGWLFVELLFVPEAMRGQGIGRKLLAMAEEEAVRRNCRNAWLDTFTFQAKAFYERLGYEVFGELPDYPQGFSRFFLKKSLKRVDTMPPSDGHKSSIAEIRARFDNDVERFSSLETGQVATIDAPLAMELITQAAIASTPQIRRVLDIGCGAGNNAVKLSGSIGSFACDLVDLSLPMLERAHERLSRINTGEVRIIQGDFRQVELPEESYDVVLAAAVLHHLRDDADWESAFRKIFSLTAPGGSVWITDLVCHDNKAVQAMMWERYGSYLGSVGGEEYRDTVFDYIDKEDTPRSVIFQLDLLRRVGFSEVELLHKNSCFAAFGAIKHG